MPCDTISKITVEMGKMDVDRVLRALAEDGSRNITVSADKRFVTWTTAEGRGHRYDSKEGTVDAWGAASESVVIKNMKQTYSRQVVRDQAQRFGWKLKQTGPNKFQVIKN